MVWKWSFYNSHTLRSEWDVPKLKKVSSYLVESSMEWVDIMRERMQMNSISKGCDRNFTPPNSWWIVNRDHQKRYTKLIHKSIKFSITKDPSDRHHRWKQPFLYLALARISIRDSLSLSAHIPRIAALILFIYHLRTSIIQIMRPTRHKSAHRCITRYTTIIVYKYNADMYLYRHTRVRPWQLSTIGLNYVAREPKSWRLVMASDPRLRAVITFVCVRFLHWKNV